MDTDAEKLNDGGQPGAPDNQVDMKKAQGGRSRYILPVLAFFFLSLNMRAPITSLPPIISELKDIFGISGGFAGLLTSIPVLCFGLLTPLIGLLMKRIRLEASVFITLLGVALGSVVRSAGGVEAAVAGTVIIGIALTVGNIAALLVIGRDFPKRISSMTGLYVCGMSCGSMGTMALTAPLSHALGWRPALALPALMALAAVALWAAAILNGKKDTRRRDGGGVRPGSAEHEAHADTQAQSAEAGPVVRRPLVWLLSAAFAAHTFLFYGITAWLPVYLEQTLGMTDAQAGVVASLFQVLGLLGSFGLPLLAGTQRFADRGLFLVVTLAWLFTAAGFWLAPAWWLAWVICGGVSSGGGFTVIFSMIMNHARDLNENRSLSTVVQTAGYSVAAVSPFAVGHLHEVSGIWQSGMILLVAASVIMIACGLAATRTGNR